MSCPYRQRQRLRQHRRRHPAVSQPRLTRLLPLPRLYQPQLQRLLLPALHPSSCARQLLCHNRRAALRSWMACSRHPPMSVLMMDVRTSSVPVLMITMMSCWWTTMMATTSQQQQPSVQRRQVLPPHPPPLPLLLRSRPASHPCPVPFRRRWGQLSSPPGLIPAPVVVVVTSATTVRSWTPCTRTRRPCALLLAERRVTARASAAPCALR